MRFPSIAIAAGLVSGAALVVSCGDLFHGTNWETLCDNDASAPGCNAGGGKTSSHTSSSRASSGSGGNGGTSANGGGGAGGSPDPCMGYCLEVVAGCMTDAPQYESLSSCTNVCEILPHDNLPMTDDIPCREKFAAQVTTDTTKCAAAGPGGNNKCGPICDTYCLLMTTRCPSVVGGLSQCAMTCMTYDPMPVYSTAVKTGNNLACRLYWAVQSVDDSTACANAGPMSTVCVDADP